MGTSKGGTSGLLDLIDLRGSSGPLADRLPRPVVAGQAPLEAVREIISQVRIAGDDALRRYSLHFDGIEIDDIQVDPAQIAQAPSKIDPKLADALRRAAFRIEQYQLGRASALGIGVCGARKIDLFEKDGIAVETYRAPLARAGIYVPGGRARYPSTVLMTAIAAKVAGVGQIAACIPPGPDGFPPVESLAAAAIAGVDQVFRIGGAQAIASMAFGTKSVPAVDVVVGPGNIYVSLAKQELAGIVSVPGAFAGPSEVVVVADASTDPLLAAVDLAVQAEHGPDGLAWLVTWSPEAVGPICEALAQVVEKSPRRVDLESTLSAGGFVAIVDGPDKAVEVINEIAPEHLEILLSDPEEVLRGVANAGAIFVGMNTPASVGDYVAGPSHVLPTNGTARFAGALSVVDFTKEMSVVKVSPEAIESVAGDVSIIALAEGLDAHSQSVLMRLPALETQSGASLDMGASNLNLVQGEDHG